MYIRCVGCKSASRVQLGRSTQEVTCNRCGRAYDLSAAAKLGATPQERYQRALAYAQANGLDLASAYSVLLGIMPLEMGRAIHEAVATVAPEPASASDSTIVPTEADCPYDLAFKQAVDQGHLTVRQAIERGDRVVFASKLVQRHGLQMSQAFMVADNRLTLHAARMQREQVSKETAPAKQSGHSGLQRHTKIVLGVGAVLLVALGIQIWRTSGPAEQSRSAALDTVQRAIATMASATKVRIDNEGQVIEVTGPDPRSVLNAYCRAMAPASRLEPLRLEKSSVSGARIGVFRYASQDSSPLAIEIRQDPGGRRWIAGTGDGPISPATAPRSTTD